MKKILSIALVLVLGLLAFAGCGSTPAPAGSADAAGDLVDLKVAATSVPHAEILNAMKDACAAEGVNLIVTEYTDYIIPNTAVEEGEEDVNYFQHLPYLEDFNAENGTHLVSVAGIHYEPMGLYASEEGKTLDDVTDGCVIAVPNDPTNEARSLQLLADNGLITLAEDAGLAATPKDIVENPLNLKFMELEAAAVARSLEDCDFAVLNGNYALEAGLTAANGLAFEASDSIAAQTFQNIIVVKEGNENNEAVQKLVKVLMSDECKAFIEEKYAGMVLPMF